MFLIIFFFSVVLIYLKSFRIIGRNSILKVRKKFAPIQISTSVLRVQFEKH